MATSPRRAVSTTASIRSPRRSTGRRPAATRRRGSRPASSCSADFRATPCVRRSARCRTRKLPHWKPRWPRPACTHEPNPTRSLPMTRKLIRNGRIVTAVDDYTADLLIDDGRIVAIGRALDAGADAEVIDAAGMLVLPGGVDCHTHMDNTFGDSTTCDSFESGTRSAAFGGTTTIVDFAFQRKEVSVLEAIERARAKGADGACIDYGFHVIVTGVDEQTLV